MADEKPLHDEPLDGFDGLYGLEILELSDEKALGRVRIQAHHLQPAGLVHGGVHAAAAEALTSIATFMAVKDDGKNAMGLGNHTSFMRPITEGTLHACATRRHKGRTTWVWEVEITDDQQRLCSLVRVTVAVR